MSGFHRRRESSEGNVHIILEEIIDMVCNLGINLPEENKQFINIETLTDDNSTKLNVQYIIAVTLQDPHTSKSKVSKMDLDEAITVTKINTHTGSIYLLIGWQSKSFETFIYDRENIWKGRFSSNRLSGFSKNLQISDKDYFSNIKRCLSQQRDDYLYELKSGFFYWKRKLKDSVIIEGFLPVELETSPDVSRPELIDVLLALNKHLSNKLNTFQTNFADIKREYHKCLNDTEEFLKLKVDMERALCNKFLNLLNSKKNESVALSCHSDSLCVKKLTLDKLRFQTLESNSLQSNN